MAEPGTGDPAVSVANPSDPTQNVRELFEAGMKRQDDLRDAEKEHIREVMDLRTALGDNERTCAKETAGLRAEHGQQLREAEAQRINAIRSVDVEAVQRAAEVQATQASTLAAQVATSAETLRTQVAAAANAATIALAAALEPIIKDIADLRRAQYEAQGQKINVVEQQSAGASSGMWIGVGIAAMTIFLSVIGVVVAVVTSG